MTCNLSYSEATFLSENIHTFMNKVTRKHYTDTKLLLKHCPVNFETSINLKHYCCACGRFFICSNKNMEGSFLRCPITVKELQSGETARLCAIQCRKSFDAGWSVTPNFHTFNHWSLPAVINCWLSGAKQTRTTWTKEISNMSYLFMWMSLSH